MFITRPVRFKIFCIDIKPKVKEKNYLHNGKAIKKFFDFLKRSIGKTASAEQKREHITPPSG
jgi:hypothetical protein